MTQPISIEQYLAEFTTVAVKSAGRLHMGFFDLHGGLGRKFGSIGLALDAPMLQLSASASEQTRVLGASSERAEKILSVLTTQLALSNRANIQGVSLHIEQHIPEHAGLGSGTQLALAIGTAVSHLYGLNLKTAEIAQLLSRGNRSGIGIGAFDKGGLLIDGGRAVSSSQTSVHKTPPLLARYDFPAHWRILLILDSTQPGIHGEEEIAAFKQLPIFSESLAAHLCRHVLMQAMPALVEQDLTMFGQSIQELQAHVGDYFAPAQGGRYASSRVGAVLEYLSSAGVACFGQSSWGPTGFAVFENEQKAEKFALALQEKFPDPVLSWQICGARNYGAEMTKSKHPEAA
jgi:beta-ribofuranosylaminobenzene 5'-phosphate synthase